MSGPSVVEIAKYLDSNIDEQACKEIAESLKRTGCLVIKDPRVTMQDNDTFIDLMERYYGQALEEKMKDVHPELSYQLGATPELIETARDHTEYIKSLPEDQKPHIPKTADPKWRYFWRVGERPETTKYEEFHAPIVIPQAFPEWTEVMDKWGKQMLEAITTVAEMLAIGLGLEKQTFTSLLHHGPHLLAPTGSDLSKWNELGQIFAGFHYDLNFLTIHGKSRFPGLYVWLRDGTKTLVRVPDGCLLIQAGKQIESLTNDTILAGYHEVVVAPETLPVIEKKKQQGESLWRVSSTLFSHIASDNALEPQGHFKTEESSLKYPPKFAGEQVREELAAIKLSKQ